MAPTSRVRASATPTARRSDETGSAVRRVVAWIVVSALCMDRPLFLWRAPSGAHSLTEVRWNVLRSPPDCTRPRRGGEPCDPGLDGARVASFADLRRAALHAR